MKRTMKFEVEIDLDEMHAGDRKECAELEGCKPSDLPTLSDADETSIADCVHSSIASNEEFFSGSEIYARIVAVRVRPAPPSQEGE